MEEGSDALNILIDNPTKKMPFGRPKRRLRTILE
jgi:hypothetical protein